jgi:anti-anti-sigma factor
VTLLARIVEEQHGNSAIARVEGEIDASNARWVEGKLRGLLTNRSDVLTVDLTKTTYLDSAGIALLFELAAALRQHQQELRLVIEDGSPIARMADLTGLRDAVATHPTLEAALG